MERDYCLLVFDSTHAAMSAERALSRLMKVTVMPTLRQITASCGMSLRVETADLPALAQALRQGVVPRGTCRLYRAEGTEVWEMKGAERDGDNDRCPGQGMPHARDPGETGAGRR